MEEFDRQTEHVEEHLHENAHESRERWVTGVALTAAILAAFAAVSSLLSGHHEHEAMMEQVQSSDQWNYYQAKGIKAAVLEERLENLQINGRDPTDAQQKKLAEYKHQQEQIKEAADEMQRSSRFHDHLHLVFAGGVTLFQVAIAVAAISALTRRPAFWYVGIAIGVVAFGFLIKGLAEWGNAVGHHVG
jgi:Flp pilus assembly protein TadB